MSRNLSYQIRDAIEKNFRLEVDKHALKGKHNGSTPIVFSFAERKNLLDTGHDLGKFLTKNFDVKMIKDVNSNMIQEFLNTKGNTCSQETLGQYVSRINKLQILINKRYKVCVDWKDIVTPASKLGPKKIRDIAMDRTDLNKILDYAYKNNLRSKAIIAIELSARFGLRVSETVKLKPMDIDFNNKQLTIYKSKGGRTRVLEISSSNDLNYLKSIIQNVESNKNIVDIKKDSVNMFLVRMEQKLGLREKYSGSKSGVHAIRKMFAQEQYDRFRNLGLSKKESMDVVSKILGHGKNRNDVIKAYVLNIH